MHLSNGADDRSSTSLDFVDVTLHGTQASSEDRSKDENSSAEGQFSGRTSHFSSFSAALRTFAAITPTGCNN